MVKRTEESLQGRERSACMWLRGGRPLQTLGLKHRAGVVRGGAGLTTALVLWLLFQVTWEQPHCPQGVFPDLLVTVCCHLVVFVSNSEGPVGLCLSTLLSAGPRSRVGVSTADWCCRMADAVGVHTRPWGLRRVGAARTSLEGPVPPTARLSTPRGRLSVHRR